MLFHARRKGEGLELNRGEQFDTVASIVGALVGMISVAFVLSRRPALLSWAGWCYQFCWHL
jgi:hypothetical protein